MDYRLIQTDEEFDELKEDNKVVQEILGDLELNLHDKGLLEPVVIQATSHRIIDGRKRLKAWVLWGKKTDIPTHIIKCRDEFIPILRDLANLHREHYREWEQIEVLDGIITMLKKEYPDHPAFRPGPSPSIEDKEIISISEFMKNPVTEFSKQTEQTERSVRGKLKVIRELPNELKPLLHNGTMDFNTARMIINLKEPQQKQILAKLASDKVGEKFRIEEAISKGARAIMRQIEVREEKEEKSKPLKEELFRMDYPVARTKMDKPCQQILGRYSDEFNDRGVFGLKINLVINTTNNTVRLIFNEDWYEAMGEGVRHALHKLGGMLPDNCRIHVQRAYHNDLDQGIEIDGERVGKKEIIAIYSGSSRRISMFSG
jgi:hypothetical protein